MEKYHDNVVSRLDSSINDTDTSLTVSYDFSGWDVPSDGWLTVGASGDFRPSTDGTPPQVETMKYSSVSYGTGTTTFSGLSRGEDNSTAQSWSSGVVVGLSVTGDLLDEVANYTYLVNFVDSDLSSGILTVNHNLNIQAPNVVIYDDSSPNIEVIPDEVRFIDNNTVEIDLHSFSVGPYDWEARIT